LDHLLAQRPDAGAIVRGAGGVRKLRVRSSGRGKKGGARVIVGRRAMSKKNPTIGEQIIEGLKEAIAYNRGEVTGARETRVSITAAAAKVKPAPRYSGARIARLRARLALSQTVFAKALNVSAETVRSWEQEKRVPDGAALRLLQVAERHPDVILENIERRSA